MAKIGDLIETVVSMVTEVGGYATQHGGKQIGLAAARKIGWAQKEQSKSGGLSGHSISGHSLACGFAGKRPKGENYSPKSEYEQTQKAQYESARLSGTGRVDPSMNSLSSPSKEGDLKRGNHIYRYEVKGAHNSKKASNVSVIRSSPMIKSVKF